MLNLDNGLAGLRERVVMDIRGRWKVAGVGIDVVML